MGERQNKDSVMHALFGGGYPVVTKFWGGGFTCHSLKKNCKDCKIVKININNAVLKIVHINETPS